MSSLPQAEGVARRLAAVAEGGELRRKAAARLLGTMDPTDAAALLDELIALDARGNPDAPVALASCLMALERDADQIPYAHAFRRLAILQELPRVAALFPGATAREEMDAGAAAKADALRFSESLGHLKTKARMTRDLDVLTRLAAYSEPSVVRNVLLNPRTTEPLVVRIAARRPARPEPLLEIFRSPRWAASHAVRRALAFNPYLPPEAGAKLLPLLTRADWAELSKDSSIHTVLREQARGLLAGGGMS